MKQFRFRWLALGLIAALAAAQAQNKSFEELMAEAERLWYADDYPASNRVLDEAIKLYPNRAEPYWRKARNNFDIVEILPRDKKPPKEEVTRRYQEVEDLGRKCQALDPQDGNCPFWIAVGMGRRASTQGILNTLGELKEFEDYLHQALKLKPTYRAANGKADTLADLYAVLGQFYRLCPDWRLVEMIFGTRGDLEKSISMMQKAVALEPQRIEHVKELGLSLICAGQKQDRPDRLEEGKKLLRSIETIPVIKPSDQVDKDHAKMLLADPTLACSYSRDAQQDLSREAFEKSR